MCEKSDWIKANTFYCKQLNAQITIKTCEDNIKHALKGKELIGKNRIWARNKRGQHNITELHKIMLLCAGCKNKEVDILKGCGKEYSSNFQGIVDRYLKRFNSGDNCLDENDVSNDLSMLVSNSNRHAERWETV